MSDCVRWPTSPLDSILPVASICAGVSCSTPGLASGCGAGHSSAEAGTARLAHARAPIKADRDDLRARTIANSVTNVLTPYRSCCACAGAQAIRQATPNAARSPTLVTFVISFVPHWLSSSPRLHRQASRSRQLALAVVGVVVAGEIDSVSHAFQPDGRLRASNSP